MNIFKTVNFRPANLDEINMSSRRGSVIRSFYEICATFGEPHVKGQLGDKIDVEWMWQIRFYS